MYKIKYTCLKDGVSLFTKRIQAASLEAATNWINKWLGDNVQTITRKAHTVTAVCGNGYTKVFEMKSSEE